MGTPHRKPDQSREARCHDDEQRDHDEDQSSLVGDPRRAEEDVPGQPSTREPSAVVDQPLSCGVTPGRVAFQAVRHHQGRGDNGEGETEQVQRPPQPTHGAPRGASSEQWGLVPAAVTGAAGR